MSEEITIEKTDWKIWVIIVLIILIISTFFITKSITRTQTINEIYSYIDIQFNACAKSCGILIPSWVNIRKGIAECFCLQIIPNGNKTNNQIPTGNN